MPITRRTADDLPPASFCARPPPAVPRCPPAPPDSAPPPPPPVQNACHREQPAFREASVRARCRRATAWVSGRAHKPGVARLESSPLLGVTVPPVLPLPVPLALALSLHPLAPRAVVDNSSPVRLEKCPPRRERRNAQRSSGRGVGAVRTVSRACVSSRGEGSAAADGLALSVARACAIAAGRVRRSIVPVPSGGAPAPTSASADAADTALSTCPAEQPQRSALGSERRRALPHTQGNAQTGDARGRKRSERASEKGAP